MQTHKTEQAGERTQPTFTKSDIGIVIDGSHESADHINKETIDFAVRYGFKVDGDLERENEDDASQFLSETADDAINFLNELDGLAYCSFYFEDNSLFYSPCIENVREDVDFVSSRNQEYPADDYEGEWLHVNDHGNCTLYVRENGEDKEIWGIV